MNEFGEYLRQLRGERSLRDIHEATGVSHTYLSTLEKGFDPRTKKKRKPSFDVLKKLADFYDVSYIELLKKADYLSEEDKKVMDEAEDMIADMGKNPDNYISGGFEALERLNRENNGEDVDSITHSFEDLMINDYYITLNNRILTNHERQKILQIIKEEFKG